MVPLGHQWWKFKYCKNIHLGSGGTQTAALAFGGGSPTATGATESYDGTAWTTNTCNFEYSKRKT
jgi:hypothetical protein